MKISVISFIKKLQQLPQNIIALFNKRTINEVNTDEKLSYIKKNQQQRIDDVIKNKPSKPFAAYKLQNNDNTRTHIKILKKIIHFFDKFLPNAKLNNMRKKSLLNEAEIWGVNQQDIIIPTTEEAQRHCDELQQKFNDETMVYLLVYPALQGSSQHIAMFLGKATDIDKNSNINYVSWEPSYSDGKECAMMLDDIEYAGVPEIIPIPHLNIEAMREQWLSLATSDINYNFTKENCSAIANYLIDHGLGINSNIKNISYLYPPEKIRERSLKLMLNRNPNNIRQQNNVNNQNKISDPLNPRLLMVKNQEQLKQSQENTNDKQGTQQQKQPVNKQKKTDKK